jgi:hypothetical protein
MVVHHLFYGFHSFFSVLRTNANLVFPLRKDVFEPGSKSINGSAKLNFSMLEINSKKILRNRGMCKEKPALDAAA